MAAEHIADDDEVVPRAACVFAHQAAEKALKGAARRPKHGSAEAA